MNIDEFFAGYEESRPIFDAVRAEVEALGESELRVSKSQIAFVRRSGFAWAWVPDRYLGPGHAPLVLSLSFREPDASARWKEVVNPAPGRYMHHLELRGASDVDDAVRGWLRRAWQDAG